LSHSNIEIDTQLEAQRGQLLDAQRNVLQSRDQIIGLTAQLAESNHLLETALKNNKELRQELKAINKCMTWKVGRLLMLPNRMVRRLILKVK
jgi:hypothetical protein